MKEKKPITRIVKLPEIANCPTLRLDPKHYIPRHRRWECRHGDRLRSKASLVRAWLDGEISSEDLLETMKTWSGLGSGISSKRLSYNRGRSPLDAIQP